MRTHLGKIGVIFVLLLTALGRATVRNAAFGQSPPKQAVTTAVQSTEDYNQRLKELARNSSGMSGSAPSDYQIGADDLLEVSVYGAADLDRTVRVSADGWISLPLTGDVRAEGLTGRQLESQIEGMLQKSYMTHPQVNVFLKEMQSHPVSVLGAVGKPGVFQLRGGKSLLEVLSMAQGLTDDAGDKVIVMHHGGVSTASLRTEATPEFVANASRDTRGDLQIDLKILLMSPNSAGNVMIYPGDVVKVPPAGIVYVIGEVRKPGGFLLKTNGSLSALQALALAEGTTRTSAVKRARIIRTEDQSGKKSQIPINLKRVLAGKAPDPILQSKDILFIPNSAGKAAFFRGAEAAVSITGGLIVYRSW